MTASYHCPRCHATRRCESNKRFDSHVSFGKIDQGSRIRNRRTLFLVFSWVLDHFSFPLSSRSGYPALVRDRSHMLGYQGERKENWNELHNNLIMSRALFIASLLRSFRAISSFKTGNTLGSSIEVVKPPLEDMAHVQTKTATFAMS